MSLQVEMSHGRSDQKIKMTSLLPRKGYKTVNVKNLNDSICRKKTNAKDRNPVDMIKACGEPINLESSLRLDMNKCARVCKRPAKFRLKNGR